MIIAHQVVIRCIFVYLGQLTKEEALELNIDNCHPYLIENKKKVNGVVNVTCIHSLFNEIRRPDVAGTTKLILVNYISVPLP